MSEDIISSLISKEFAHFFCANSLEMSILLEDLLISKLFAQILSKNVRIV